MQTVRAGFIVGLLAVFSGAAFAADLTGSVEFLTRRGQRPNLEETLVWLDAGGRLTAPPAGRFRIRTLRKTLVPHVLAVPLGSTVDFPNEDPISHNLFSLSSPNEFDLGFYRRGAGKSETFDSPGVINVYCNVHPEMSAVIHVMTTPFYVFTDRSGSFRIGDVPPGKYRVYAWNEIGGSSFVDVDLPAGGLDRVVVTIDGRKHRDSQHLNKEGKPYQRSRRRDY